DWKEIIESDDLTNKEKFDIKSKFINADSIIKEISLKSLSKQYCSILIDVKEIVKSLEGVIDTENSLKLYSGLDKFIIPTS
ncbi:4130_t:CDS:1, partial [Dentiscutata heterogama]